MTLESMEPGTGIHLGVHNPRTLRPSSDSSDTERGQRIAKSFVRCPLPGALKSLGPLACVGSTPTPISTYFHRDAPPSASPSDPADPALGITWGSPDPDAEASAGGGLRVCVRRSPHYFTSFGQRPLSKRHLGRLVHTHARGVSLLLERSE